jgi:hypothetical protein
MIYDKKWLVVKFSLFLGPLFLYNADEFLLMASKLGKGRRFCRVFPTFPCSISVQCNGVHLRLLVIHSHPPFKVYLQLEGVQRSILELYLAHNAQPLGALEDDQEHQVPVPAHQILRAERELVLDPADLQLCRSAGPNEPVQRLHDVSRARADDGCPAKRAPHLPLLRNWQHSHKVT